MEASLRLHHHQPGTLTGLDKYLFGRTSGMIGSLSQLVRGAAILAIQGGSEQITQDLLDLVPVDHAAQRRVPGGPHAGPGREHLAAAARPGPSGPARDPRLLAAPPRRCPRPEHRRPARSPGHRPGRPRGRHARPAGRLAAVTGYPAGNLALALPELRVPEPGWLSLRHLAQRACPRCTARHQGGPVRRLFAHHEYLCTRHGYWTGPPDPSRDDPPRPLAAQVPELAAAQRTLGRIRRLHGWAATFDATAAATSICIELRIRTVHQPLWTRWERRLELLTPGDWRRSLFMAGSSPKSRRSPRSSPPRPARPAC